ncbi:MAG TPA: FHA domain-containing protein, partial [Candidatus Tumulicola sp.]
MTFDAHMRIGSLEITAALLAVAVVAARPRVRAAAEIGRLMPMAVSLEFSGRAYDGRPPFEVGRGRELDLALPDPEVSRRHVRFESRNGVVYVDDLKSRN